MRGLSLVAASGGHSSSRCAGLSPSQPLPLRSTGSRCAGSAAVAHGPSCSAACGIFPDQGSNPHPLHWQVDSQPLRHQGSPSPSLLNTFKSHFSLAFKHHVLDPSAASAAEVGISSLHPSSFLFLAFSCLFRTGPCC